MMKKTILQHKKKIFLLLIVLLLCVWTVWGNITVGLTVVEVQDETIPKSFHGFKIMQISDLHNAVFGEGNVRLIEIIKESQPDLIALTGDLVDSDRTDIDLTVSFVRQAAGIAPCYFVVGNHEAWIGNAYRDFERQLRECGVTILHNETVWIESGGSAIQMIGIDDPDFRGAGNGVFGASDDFLSKEIDDAGIADGYNILLSHRPESFNVYCEKGISLVLAGHAHGGQFRLPLIGGVVAPGQGLFPRYDSGVYKREDTTMIVSRGIGNSVIPIRFNNRPEVICITLLHK